MTIGLTGGIGSGKSTVARVFELMGCKVLNSDDLAKQSYFKPHIQSQIVALLGAEAYLSESQLNKSFIANKIFNDKNLLHKINAIIHPEVKKEFELYSKSHPQDIIVKETALLFEAGLAAEVDKRVVVVAPDDLRIRRVMLRDGLTAEQVKERMAAQMSQDKKIALSDFVIHNDEEQLVIPQVLKIVGLFGGGKCGFRVS